MLRKKKGDPRPQGQGMVDSGNESISEVEEEQEEAHEPTNDHGGASSSRQDRPTELTKKVYAFWDEH